MAPPAIAKGIQYPSKGISNHNGYLMIHAMAEYIYFEGRMIHAWELLEMLGRGSHFSIVPSGQVVQHADPRSTLWQARGANRESCGVEMLIPGVYDLTALYTKINSSEHYYRQSYYDGLLTIQKHLKEQDYLRSPAFNWDTHSAQSRGRKFDPGSSFSIDKWTDMLREEFGER